MSAMPVKASVTKSSRPERIRHPEVDSFDLATIMRALGDPVRIEMVREVDAEGEMICTELYDRLVTRARAAGTNRIVSVRRDDLESRFPGLVDVILRDPA
jgi:DNA-binding transcriptional ArsR family regulator